MTSSFHIDRDAIWQALDGNGRSARVFYPSRGRSARPPFAHDYDIPVAPGVTVGARWHRFAASDASVLAFHGNGETVSNYDDVAPGWQGVGVNLFMTDYRGYGWSGGKPTLRALHEDAGTVAAFFLNQLAEVSGPKPLLFGRSLGSFPATRVAVERGSDFQALILESGFGDVAPLLQMFGFQPSEISSEIRKHLSNCELLKGVRIPVLVLHGELDSLLPPSNAQANFAAIPHDRKMLRLMEGVGHNDIMGYGNEYFGAIADFLRTIES